MLSRPLRRKRQKLSDVIVESVKRSIVTDALKPGDRLPTERELMESFQCSKGSAREALKALEVEGLVSTRTGPSGGAYLNQAGTEPASRALRNYLHFQHLDGEQVYQLRKVIEVELAVSVLGRLSEDDYQALQDNVDFCSAPEDSEAGQREQRLAELEFHNLLAKACPNPLLSFMAQFLNDLLRDLVVLKSLQTQAQAVRRGQPRLPQAVAARLPRRGRTRGAQLDARAHVRCRTPYDRP